jgi:glycosidase
LLLHDDARHHGRQRLTRHGGALLCAAVSWTDAVVYQIYPRSFQDSDGDGVGDLRGIHERLDHIASLGAAAIWLSPIYPSPLADFGYDVADYTNVDPVYGDLDTFDALATAAHDRGLKVLMDLVPCHTSIEHPWFKDHPERYVWSPVDGPPNNWIATFGGPAWSPDPSGRGWYLHSFYPEQPDLDWRRDDVREAMADVIRFWTGRGVDGFRIDAIDRLLKDPKLRDDPPAHEPFPLPLDNAEFASLDHIHSMNAPDIGDALQVLRDAAGDKLLVGEVFQPSAKTQPYLDYFDRVFAFELFFADWDTEHIRRAVEGAAKLVSRNEPGAAWVMSNHDFPRLPTRFGPENVRVAATLLLTLPGMAFIYQGDEIGLADGPGHDPPYDRAGRDGARHPMQWDPTTNGGFTGENAEPWLAVVDPQKRNVADQTGDPHSLLNLYRRLIALRPHLGAGIAFHDSPPGTLVYDRGTTHRVALNLTADEQTLEDGRTIAPHEAVIEEFSS